MSRDRARYLCIHNLAHKIWKDVQCELADRAQEDWLAAERCIDAHPEIIDEVTGSCWPDDYSEDAFEASHGRLIYERAFLPLMAMTEGGLPKPPYV